MCIAIPKFVAGQDNYLWLRDPSALLNLYYELTLKTLMEKKIYMSYAWPHIPFITFQNHGFYFEIIFIPI